jgi:hypothetical protein
MDGKRLKLTINPPVVLRNLLRETCRVSMCTSSDRCSLNGPQNSQVASASAEDAVQSLPDLPFGWPGILIKQHLGIHNHAIHTVPALRRLLIDECLLERMGMRYASQTLECRNVPVLRIAHRHAARPNCIAVHDHRATAALRKTAPEPWAFQSQVVAQDVQQRSAGIYIDGLCLSIHFERNSRHNKSLLPVFIRWKPNIHPVPTE